jgi:hypothetical protein
VADYLTGLRSGYMGVKQACRTGFASAETGTAIQALVRLSLTFLQKACAVVELNSRVPGKTYRAYRRGDASKIISRPANCEYFLCDAPRVDCMWNDWNRRRLSADILPQFLYTLALAPCLALELFDRQNMKGPATYFECFVGHLMAGAVGTEPRKRAVLPVEGRSVRLTMDFIFDLEDRASLHLAVKMSTRERVVQAWAHQRLLDSAFGIGRYRGIMVLFGETKLDSRSHEVVEICVPDQWLAYQALLAQMERIYYFDPPDRYRQLATEFPGLVKLRPFAEFFTETTSVLRR